MNGGCSFRLTVTIIHIQLVFVLVPRYPYNSGRVIEAEINTGYSGPMIFQSYRVDNYLLVLYGENNPDPIDGLPYRLISRSCGE